MKEVLIIAHHFPPMGGPGTVRSVAVVRNLPAYGYKPTVLTISEADARDHFHPMDDSMTALVKGVEVVRVPSREPRRLKQFLRRARLMRLVWYFFFPLFWESSALWPLSAYRTAKSLVEARGIRLVYTTSSPYSSILLAFLLKISLDVKWVADLRDPYTDGYMWQWPSRLHWGICRLLERMLLRFPDMVVVNTPAVAALYREREYVKEDRIQAITNGYLC